MLSFESKCLYIKRQYINLSQNLVFNRMLLLQLEVCHFNLENT